MNGQRACTWEKVRLCKKWHFRGLRGPFWQHKVLRHGPFEVANGVDCKGDSKWFQVPQKAARKSAAAPGNPRCSRGPLQVGLLLRRKRNAHQHGELLRNGRPRLRASGAASRGSCCCSGPKVRHSFPAVPTQEKLCCNKAPQAPGPPATASSPTRPPANSPCTRATWAIRSSTGQWLTRCPRSPRRAKRPVSVKTQIFSFQFPPIFNFSQLQPRLCRTSPTRASCPSCCTLRRLQRPSRPSGKRSSDFLSI